MTLDLNEYRKLAIYLIRKHGNKRIYNDEDAISFVMDYMMKSDATYDGITGSQSARRVIYGTYAIKNYIKTILKKIPVSLDSITNLVITDKKDNNPVDQSIKQEVMQFIDNSSELKPKQKKFIKMHFLDNMTYAKIGEEHGITREAVRQHINNGLKKLRSKFGD